MKNLKLIFLSTVTFCLLGTISSGGSLENAFLSKTNKFIDTVTANFTNLIKGNDRVKYLDLKVDVQESLKPTISMTNVNRITEKANRVFFNQNSLSIHDNDQTINFGLGYRYLINEDKLLLGGNIFLDYSFDEQHQRQGVGVEAISSVFDLRGNYYDATSGIQTLGDGSTEEALDGWDARFDYHLPVSDDIRIFAGFFEFENAAGTFELDGEKYGLSGRVNKLSFEAGYIDDNKTGDGSFANITYVFPLGNSEVMKKSSSRNFMEYVSVRDRLYEPVKRENKIRIVKISAANIVVSGF